MVCILHWNLNLFIQPRPESLSAPDGVCEDGEGWACSGEIVSESPFFEGFTVGNFNVGVTAERSPVSHFEG